jgi:hypothetical protein
MTKSAITKLTLSPTSAHQALSLPKGARVVLFDVDQAYGLLSIWVIYNQNERETRHFYVRQEGMYDDFGTPWNGPGAFLGACTTSHPSLAGVTGTGSYFLFEGPDPNA